MLPKVHGLTEIGAVAFNAEYTQAGYRLTETGAFGVLVQPVRDMAYTPYALDLQGRTLEQLADTGVSEKHAYGQFFEFVKQHTGEAERKPYKSPADFWAHEAGFDFGFVKAWSDRCGHPADFPKRCDWACTKQYFRILGRQGRHSCAYDGLDKIMAHYGIPADSGQRHTALYDCRQTLKCLEKMLTSV